MKFRTDINGLRAIAVIAVLVFHFYRQLLPGGFAGVDVFFVISGFLMTGIIFRGLGEDNFSILKFYIARANRIIPAIGVLAVVLLVFGWFRLIPVDYDALALHAVSSILFVSNFVYWQEVGYFEAAASEKWLLHSWSLSVEWQFYIVYPLILVLAKKFLTLENLKRFVVVGTILGFLFSVVATHVSAQAAYFLFPTRAWEMLLGGVAYLYPWDLKQARSKQLEWLGIALIILSCVFIDSTNPWPGYLALLPVGGTFLVIQANRSDSILTSNTVFQHIGKWSYSIYLWHWPVLVFLLYYGFDGVWLPIGMIVSILLGYLSWRFLSSSSDRCNTLFLCR